jgi:hypothetical protein
MADVASWRQMAYFLKPQWPIDHPIPRGTEIEDVGQSAHRSPASRASAHPASMPRNKHNLIARLVSAVGPSSALHGKRTLGVAESSGSFRVGDAIA